MAPSLSLFCAVLFIFLQLSLFVNCFHYIKPEILSEYETIISAGDNFTVLCQGETPLTWKLPDVKDENYSQWTVIDILNVLPKNSTFKYASRLFIHNATFPFTGFYKCHGTNIDPSDNDLVASIYLYVKDDEHLSATIEDIDTIFVTQYSDAVIPCRPTSPDVRVELYYIDGMKKPKVYLGIIDEEGIMYRFHPHFGFITNNTKEQDQKLYVCKFANGLHNFSVTIIMEVEPLIHSVPKPLLEELSGGHTVVGQQLILECKVKILTFITINWITPTGPPDLQRMELSPQQKTPMDPSMVTQQLTINQTTLKDKGTYYCNVSDNQNHHSVNSLNVIIYRPDEHFINLTEENGLYDISRPAGVDSVQWRIDVNGHPQPNLFWLNNNNETISNERKDKYEISFRQTEANLKIKDIAITDYGNYTLIAQNDFETKALVLFLNVTDRPSVSLESDDFHIVNQVDEVRCVVAAHPEATISWSFKPCLDNSCQFHSINETSAQRRGLQIVSRVRIKSLNTGFIKCLARNSLGGDEMTKAYYVTDVRNGLDIFGFDDSVNINSERNEVEVAVGESLKMTCGASVHNYSSNLTWLRDNKPLENDEKHRVDSSHTDYSNRLTLNLQEVDFDDANLYSCVVGTIGGKVVTKNITLRVSEPTKPIIVQDNMKKNMELLLPNRVTFYCLARGVPKPSIIWLKNDERIQPSNRTHFQDGNQRLYYSALDYRDKGTYRCVVSNKAGTVSKKIHLDFKNTLDSGTLDRKVLWIIIAVLVVVVVCFAIFVIIKVRNERKLQKELECAGLANFEKGALENLNPDLGLDDQAELLPYDKQWEFPIEKLKLGKQLGSGAFGVVMKGIAKGIVEGEESTIVAVKMVKKHADYTYIRALASELKIMVHLGKHLNVVNLLGACTKNVAKRELLVIVEFCRFGNLQNYLLRHRENFIDQVDPKTGHIDYTIGQEILERTYSVSSNRSNSQSPYMKYAALSFSNSNGNNPHMVDYRGDNYNGTSTAKTDITTVSMSPNSDEEEIILSNNSSVQPEWRSNYHGDYKDNIKPICTKDLLAWAFQVSRGMEYLASRRVLHGDLAARNILLADNNVVKICDFGLAKSMYKSDNYKKKGDGPLPVKWMAVESIRDKIFSTQSDVWSFGIVLWEFFSLAKTPYPGMEADERLYNKLLDGYRMESPEYAPKEIYKMMSDCWHAKPLLRPTFSKLSERIGSLLEDTVRRHYIDLNDPYLVMNTQRLEDGHSDYLAMLSPPNFENLSTPQYVNDLPHSDNTPGYMCMKSANIFSPRVDDARVFDFDVNKTRSVEGTRNELAPMLGVQSESDCESSTCNSPVAPNSFSNPTYHLPPVVDEKGQIKFEKDIVKFSDNYVNMPQNKSVLKDNNPFSTKPKETAYVNSSSRDWESVQL
ncbi:vascular endothelial growth factor receptor 1 isoform X1 [Tribolium castaneum]|uniref:vascular endothelial growth factor receptor 1 isoform X1 n=2 Tax=Tribolium castaneum TaxID=7070 RepID=UPI00046BFFA1|nr:PREDICTED: vascular endothelial growth factor receptor 1 isoform X1 [Tribolium castaneum]|eukprot:XP_008191844.1 PREDICTED: vascular endothelial growth factor receptor 1 isoform X1 [Tribolium castaneum]